MAKKWRLYGRSNGKKKNKRRAENRMNNDDNSSNDTGGSDFSEPTAGGDATFVAKHPTNKRL